MLGHTLTKYKGNNMKTLNSANVYEVEEGEEVAVWCPVRLEWVGCRVDYMSIADADNRIYITTLDSRTEEYNNRAGETDNHYGDYIKHLRGNDSFAAVMGRDKMAQLLESREYRIA